MHRVLAYLISDEMSISIKQLDASVSAIPILYVIILFVSFLLFYYLLFYYLLFLPFHLTCFYTCKILGKLLVNSLYCLNFENATAINTLSCSEIASRCCDLRELNLRNCISILVAYPKEDK